LHVPVGAFEVTLIGSLTHLSSVAANAPESATLLLMGLGFLFTGRRARRRN
jgi:hypothetical protein